MAWTALVELGVLIALIGMVVWAIRRKPENAQDKDKRDLGD